jgi:hypothetical protein
MLLAQMAPPSEVQSFIADLDANQRFVLAIVAIGCATGMIVALVSVIGGMVFRLKERQVEADLKRDMLDRGMSADEIQKIIESTPQSGVDRWLGSWCKKK